jgi:DNA processing protein
VSLRSSEAAAWLALAELGNKATRPWVLLAAELGSASAVLGATAGRLSEAGATAEQIAALAHRSDAAEIESVLAACARGRIRILGFDDDAYPPLLRRLEDPPLALYAIGDAEILLRPSVAVVGSRNASRYGRRIAAELCRALAAAGICVTSGLAFGIDAAAHEAALSSGTSAAVLAGGVDVLHPKRHRELYEKLRREGCVVSEMPPGTATLPFRFPIRNRIVTGLCAATVVVEANIRSGSLVSARHAAEQGRDVYAVPGPIDAPTSTGTNALIRDGAIPLVAVAEAVEQIAASVGLEPAPAVAAVRATDVPPAMDAVSLRVFTCLDAEPASVEAIAAASGLDESVVMAKVTSLELDGVVERLPGGTYARTGTRSGALSGN